MHGRNLGAGALALLLLLGAPDARAAILADAWFQSTLEGRRIGYSHERRETAVEGAWVATVPIERAVLMRADETVLEELAVENNTARFRAGPRGLVTIGVRVTR